MDRFPLMWRGAEVGEVTVARDGLYVCFSAAAQILEGLWCVWIVGEQGEFRLGVLEPRDGQSVIRRRISGRMTAPFGRLLRGEVRSVSRETSGWECASSPAGLFRSEWLRRRLELCEMGWFRREPGRLYLAVPYGVRTPFRLETLFCFAHIREICGERYAVFLFDEAERPLFPK